MGFITGQSCSWFVLFLLQLHSVAVALKTRRESEVCKLVINATFNPDQIKNKSHSKYQEPERMLDNDTWALLRLDLNGTFPEQGTTTQAFRIPSLNKLYAALPQFFRAVFPGGIWHLNDGSLIAAGRTGAVMPWDLDGDLAVNMTQFITKATMDALHRVYGEPIAYSKSKECVEHAESERCPVWNISNDILFATLPLDEHPTYSYFSRFIDRRTGYFIEIVKNEVANSTTQNSINGTLLPVPREPSVEKWLLSNYDNAGLHLGELDEKTMFECRCPEEHFKVLAVQPDSFQLMVMQPCGATSSDDPWDLAEVDTAAACCRVTDKAEDPSIPVRIMIPWRATVDFADF